MIAVRYTKHVETFDNDSLWCHYRCTEHGYPTFCTCYVGCWDDVVRVYNGLTFMKPHTISSLHDFTLDEIIGEPYCAH